jgi:hypothetical protein
MIVDCTHELPKGRVAFPLIWPCIEAWNRVRSIRPLEARNLRLKLAYELERGVRMEPVFESKQICVNPLVSAAND